VRVEKLHRQPHQGRAGRTAHARGRRDHLEPLTGFK